MFQRLVKLPCCLGWNRGSRSKRWTPQRSRFWHSEAWGCFFLRRGFLRTLGGPWSSIISTHIRPIIIIITTAHVIYWTYKHKSNFLHHEKFARKTQGLKSNTKISIVLEGKNLRSAKLEFWVLTSYEMSIWVNSWNDYIQSYYRCISNKSIIDLSNYLRYNVLRIPQKKRKIRHLDYSIPWLPSFIIYNRISDYYCLFVFLCFDNYHEHTLHSFEIPPGFRCHNLW